MLDIHIPTPGDHYSPATGSALMTIIYELAREHERHGGQTRIVVGRGTRHDYPIGVPVEVEFPPLLSRRAKGADAALGRLGLPRRFGPTLYEPALRAVERDFDGALFVHNNPAPISMLTRHSPGARLCLYLNNVANKLAAQTAAFHDRPNLGLCSTGFEIVVGNGTETRPGYGGHDGTYADLLRGCGIALSTVMVRREAFNETGGFRSFATAEDWDLWLRIAQRRELHHLAEVMAHYRLHTGSISGDYRQVYRDAKLILAEHVHPAANDREAPGAPTSRCAGLR